jgi:penicillin amidase
VDGAWRGLERRVETYLGREGEVVAVDTVLYTHRGPMRREGGRWLSMRWTVLESSSELGALLAAARASSAEQWLRATAAWGAPAQNMLVADRAGTIAIRATGKYPLRPDDGGGERVRDGSRSSSDWTGWRALSRYPFAIRPAQGFLASANQQPVDPRVDPSYLGTNWVDPWRAIRINALLRADSAVTPDAMRRFQTDAGSARADLFAPAFLEAAERVLHAGRGDDRLRVAARLLGEWDRRYTRDNERAVLFEMAMDQLASRTWDELVPERGPGRRVATPSSAVLAALLRDPTNAWWDDRRTRDERETADDILSASLRAALDSAERSYGRAVNGGWRWDRVHHANIYHLLHIDALSRLGLSVQGGPSTLNVSPGRGTFGPSWRMVVELGPEVRAWGIYPGGQSGDPTSRRYDDRLPRWLAGELDTLRVPRDTAALGAAHTSAVLTLSPAARTSDGRP